MVTRQVVIPTDLNDNDFNEGTDVPNTWTVNVDGVTISRGTAAGLVAAGTTFNFNGGTSTLEITQPGQAQQDIDLSGLMNAAEIYVTGGSLVNNVLTLTDNDTGTPDVSINLADLIGPSSDADNIAGTGADGKTKITQAQIETIADDFATDRLTNTFNTVNLGDLFPS